MTKEEYNYFGGQILDGAIQVHREMGPGLLESVYQFCLADELRSRGILVDEQVYLPLFYKGKTLQKHFKLDMIIEKEILVEIKAVEILLPVHEAQLISYLKLSGKKLGYLINFNIPLLKDGFKRFVNNF